jgi:hypothetical protein
VIGVFVFGLLLGVLLGAGVIVALGDWWDGGE